MAKISERLTSVAEPWTNRLGPDPPRSTIVFVYEVSSLIWNASRLSDPARRQEALEDVRALLAPRLPDLPGSAVVDLIEEIHDRARRLYPDDPRHIVGTDVERQPGGKYHVLVVSVRPG